MYRNLVVLGIVVALVGCSTPPSRSASGPSQTASTIVKVEIDQEKIEEAHAAVKEELRDPESAVFRNTHGTSVSEDGPLMGVCGEVNAKNGYGGFTGFAPFAYSQGKAYVWRRSQRINADNAIIEISCGL